MFGYNPTVQDRSGEIAAQGTINSANSISQGITSLGSSLGKIGEMYNQARQADATAKVANGMGIIDDNTLQMIQDTPWHQKSNLSSNLIQMIGQKTMADRYETMAGIAQQRVDQAGAKAAGGSKGMGISPWSGSAVPGAFTSGGSTLDDQ
jgi:hypothetical protein